VTAVRVPVLRRTDDWFIFITRNRNLIKISDGSHVFGSYKKKSMSSEVPENVTKRNSLVGEGGVSGERAAPPPKTKAAVSSQTHVKFILL